MARKTKVQRVVGADKPLVRYSDINLVDRFWIEETVELGSEALAAQAYDIRFDKTSGQIFETNTFPTGYGKAISEPESWASILGLEEEDGRFI